MSAEIPSSHVRVRRAYDQVGADDGERVLIDRIWPRGIKKEDLKLADWNKDLAPSTELRKWFGHEPPKWEEFRRRYAAELREHAQAPFKALRERARKGVITLVFGAKNEAQNNAVAMREFLLNADGLNAKY